jgi:hypothetical protein
MVKGISTIQKYAWGFALMFLAVYSLDYVPGVMAENGKMFGLFSMTTIVDVGHLGLGVLAVISALISAKAARIYFYFLGVYYALDVIVYVATHFTELSPLQNLLINLPHAVISIAAFIIAAKVDRHPASSTAHAAA